MAYERDNNEVIAFKIEKHVGTLVTYQTGWSKELNVVSWNGGVPKYDLRDWDPAHEKMNRGITLHPEEMKALVEIMRDRNIDMDFPKRSEPDMER